MAADFEGILDFGVHKVWCGLIKIHGPRLTSGLQSRNLKPWVVTEGLRLARQRTSNTSRESKRGLASLKARPETSPFWVLRGVSRFKLTCTMPRLGCPSKCWTVLWRKSLAGTKSTSRMATNSQPFWDGCRRPWSKAPAFWPILWDGLRRCQMGAPRARHVSTSDLTSWRRASSSESSIICTARNGEGVSRKLRSER